jgi:ribosome biogenesis protein ENP2
MEVQQRNDTKIYALSNGPNLPEWIGERARRNLAKRDSSIRRRIELLQDFAMPASSNKLVQSKDGRFIIAAGTYSPRIRCFELDQLSMKFERYVDSDIVDMIMLGEDYGKMALLQSDRSILFHAPYGQHHTIKIPTFGRMMAYEPTTCELLVACSGKAGRNSVSKTLGGGEVYRINLEEGRFAAPLNYSASNKSKGSVQVVGGNCISVSPMNALTALGGDDGIVRFWDNRVPQGGAQDDMNLNPFCTLDVKSSTAGYGFYDDSSLLSLQSPNEVTALAFDHTGMQIAAGTKGGNVALYDIRSSKPLHVKEHQYGMPIHTLRFHSASGTILSGDPKLVKVWRSKPSAVMASYGTDSYSNVAGNEDGKSSSAMGSIVANIEGTANFTNFIVGGDTKDPSGNTSGLVLCAGEQAKMQAFYCPVLGSAPRWCSFLDSITEELEEKDRSEEASNMDITGQTGGSIYEDYKFLTRAEIDTLGIQNLVGTPLLRGYMHGFFIDIGLYNRIRAVANPFEYEEYRKKKIRDKMEEKRSSRIAPKKQKKAVNSTLADRLESKAGEGKKASKAATNLLTDDRFGGLFNNPDYQIDEDDINFKLRNPSGVQIAKMAQDDDMDSDKDDSDSDGDTGTGIASGFKRVDSEGEDDWGNGSDDESVDGVVYNSDDSEEDGFRGARVRGDAHDENKAAERELRKKKKAKKDKSKKTKSKKNIMYEAEDYETGVAAAVKIGLGGGSDKSASKKRREVAEMSLADRTMIDKEKRSVISETRRVRVKGKGASSEISFIPKDVLKKRAAEEAKKKVVRGSDDQRKRTRRGIKDLGFKTPFKNTK